MLEFSVSHTYKSCSIAQENIIRTAFVGAVVARIAALIVKEQSTENGPAEKGGRAGMSRSAKHSVSFSISFLQRFNLALSLSWNG